MKMESNLAIIKYSTKKSLFIIFHRIKIKTNSLKKFTFIENLSLLYEGV